MAEQTGTITQLLKDPDVHQRFAQAPSVDEASQVLVDAGAQQGHRFSKEDVVTAIVDVLPPKDQPSDADRNTADVIEGFGCWNTYMHSEMICNTSLCG